MKILFVSQYFPPEMGAPAARVYELSREWAHAGHDVTVLTGFPNHPTGVIPPEYRGSLVRRESVDGIRVVRTPIYAAANKGLVRRSANYVSFGLSASTVGIGLVSRPDIVIGTSPQMLTAIAGLWIARWFRVPFVFDVRDLWPRSIVEVGAMPANSPLVRALELVEQSLYERSDHIVVVSEGFIEEIVAKKIERQKISVITNGVDLELFRPRDRDEARRRLGLSTTEKIVSYVGTHGMAHGLGTALEAAQSLRADNVRLLFVGEGAEKARLQEQARKLQLENVTFWDARPRDEVADVLSASDVCIVLLRDLPVFKTVIPSKLFEIMAAARPIVMTVDGEARRLLDRSGGGVFAPPENPAVLAETIRGLIRSPERADALGRAGRLHVEQCYSRTALASQYIRVLESVLR